MLVPLNLPPGVYANGTDRQSAGRYRDSNHVRWFEGTLRPEGGWVQHSAEAVDGAARACHAWADNGDADSGQPPRAWLALGTNSNLYVMDRSGALYDITPSSGYMAGPAGAVVGGGYGGGDFGGGEFGEPGTDPGLIEPATVWSLDNFGELLVATNADDGKAYSWDLNTSHAAAALPDAPDHNRALVVTEEDFLLLLGADGNPRLVQWADQQSLTDWTPDPTIQAGSFPLQTPGKLMCGKRVRGGTLLFTDQDVHLAVYQGAPLIYGFERVGSGCGVISQGAVIVGGDATVAWMGRSSFWTFDGYAKPLPCDVSDRVFADLNRVQASLITGFHSAAYGEMTWFYPSAGSSENDRYVRWNYRENHWAIGALARTCGEGEGVFDSPLLVAADGKVYAHESGFAYDGDEPYAETGPLEIGNGDQVYTALALIPDEQALGEVQATFYGRLQPTDTERIFGPYTMPRTKTDVRFTARQSRMRLTGRLTEGVGTDWRIGDFRLDVTLGGLR